MAKASRSSMVSTVSRCMYARVAGSWTAISRVAVPSAKSRPARFSTAWAVVRSPMPTMTAPLPRTCTSPPSSVPTGPSRIGSGASEANIGWNR